MHPGSSLRGLPTDPIRFRWGAEAGTAAGVTALAAAVLAASFAAAPAGDPVLSLGLMVAIMAAAAFECHLICAAPMPLTLSLILIGAAAGPDGIHPGAVVAAAGIAGAIAIQPGVLGFFPLPQFLTQPRTWLCAAAWASAAVAALAARSLVAALGAGLFWQALAAGAGLLVLLPLAAGGAEAGDLLRRWSRRLTQFAPGAASAVVLGAGTVWLWRQAGGAAVWAFAAVWLTCAASNWQAHRMGGRLAAVRARASNYREVLAAVCSAVNARDQDAADHSPVRVQQFALGLALAAGADRDVYRTVELAALVQDIGKLGVPERILGKRGNFTAEEFGQVQQHVDVGADILRAAGVSIPLVEAVESHHERWDGRGYPRRLRGEAIPLAARILAVADTYNAVTSNRPHRAALRRREAVRVLRDAAGKQLDPGLVELFIEILPDVERTRPSAAGSDEPAAAAENQALLQIATSSAEMAAVCRIAPQLAEKEDLDEALDLLAQEALRLLPVVCVFIFVTEPDGSLKLRAGAGEGLDAAIGRTLPLGAGVSGWAASRQQSRSGLSASLEAEALGIPTPERRHVTAVPMLQSGSTLGVMSVWSPSHERLPEQRIPLLTVLADHAAGAIGSLQRLDQSRELAYKDSLTGLPNQRRLVAEMDAALAAWRENETPFSVLMIDIDRFKQVNDDLGHLVGDSVLRSIAHILAELVQPPDLAARYAGDEFVLLVHGNRAADVRNLAHEIRSRVEGLSPVHGQVAIGASVGVATCGADGETVAQLLQRADQRMYGDKLARRTGRW